MKVFSASPFLYPVAINPPSLVTSTASKLSSEPRFHVFGQPERVLPVDASTFISTASKFKVPAIT